KPAKVFKIDDYNFKIILYEGMYHQIRRMVKLCNNSVVELKRIRIGKYKLDNIPLGGIIKIEK
nr:16S rRNA pseudouridine(516) synthase [Acholeplasmatales bacterium]